MANDTTLNPGVGGDTIADEDIAGVKYQRIKIIDATVGSTDPAGVVTNPLRTDPTGTTTQPISAASLPLPTGAALELGNLATLAGKDFATAARQDIGNTSLASIDGKLTNPLPISGTVTANAGSNLNTSLLALDATLTGGAEKAQLYDPNFAQSAMVDQLRGAKISNFVRVFGDSFADGIGSGQDAGSFPKLVATAGAGSGGVSSGQLALRTGDAVSGSTASLQSVNQLVFVTGSVSGCQSGIKFPTTPTTWKIVSRKDGVDSAVTVFNGTANTPDGTFHRYEIFFQGAGSAKFMVDSILLHSLSGQPSAVRTSTLDFYIRYEITNDSTNTIARYGAFDTQNGYFFEAVYPVADLSINVRGSTAFRMGPGADSIGYQTALQANAVQESGGNIEKLLSYFIAQQLQLLTDIRADIRMLNSNVCAGLNVQDDTDRMRVDPYYFQ